MPSFGPVLRRLQRNEPIEAAGDAELLHQFLSDHSAPAFEAIVRRHGPLVMRVCQRELPVLADAEDAFQATFLLLAQKARTIRRQSNLASWLIGVARRLARRLGQQLRQRRRRLAQMQPAPLRPITTTERPEWWEDERRLLPQEYQTVIDLCLIQCLTRDEAARQLGQTPQAVHGMLYRARIKLKKQLLQRGTVTGSLLVGTSAAASAIDRLAPVIAQSAVRILQDGSVATGLASPTVISLLQPRLSSAWLIPAVFVGGILAGGLGWWGIHSVTKKITPSSPITAILPATTGPSSNLPSPPVINDLPPPAQQQMDSGLTQAPNQLPQQSGKQQTINPPGQSGAPLPQISDEQKQGNGGKDARAQPPVIPVPPADRLPTGSERLNLAKGMLSTAGSLHESMVPLLPHQSKHTFDGKPLILSLITTEEELANCTKKLPQVKTPPNVQVAEDPAWNGGLFGIDWQKEVLLVAVVLERANSVTLTTVEKCWIAPDANGVGHLLLNYSGKESNEPEAKVEDYRKHYPYVMLKVPRQDLKKVAVTVWRTGPRPDGILELPNGK